MERNIEFFRSSYREDDLRLDTVIVGIDPGVTTGFSAIAFDSSNIPQPQEVEHWGSGQLSYGGSGNAKDLIEGDSAFAEQKIVELIATLVSQLSHSDYERRRVIVVIEDFIIRKQNSTRDFLSPVRITAGLLQVLFRAPNVKIMFQSPSDAKSICTDDRMDKWGYTIKTQKDRHSRDADRHAVLCLRRILEKPRLMDL